MTSIRIQVDQDHWNIKDLKEFSGGEVHVDLDFLPTNCSDFSLTVRCQSSADIMRMVMVVDALNRRYKGIKGTLVIPYLPYARQDRVCASGQHFGLDAFIKILATLNVRVKFFDVHSEVALSLMNNANVSYVHVPQASIITKDPKLRWEIASGLLQVVAPDAGSLSKVNALNKVLGGLTPAIGYKVRDPATGQLTGFDVSVLDFKGQDVIIVDDICDAGGTFLGLAKVLKERNCGKITLYVTHGIFSKGLGVFEGIVDEIITTNTFRAPWALASTKVKFRSIKVV